MIIYFSATGNTRFVAEELAAKTGDTSLNLLKKIRENDFSAITSDKPFVICVPAYAALWQSA